MSDLLSRIKTKPMTAKDQFRVWILAIVGLADNFIIVLSLGFMRPHWHAAVLFSDWMDG